MAGNVYQWTSSDARGADAEASGNDVLGALRGAMEGNGGLREVRGGSFESPPEALRTIATASRDGQKWAPDVGFRCLVPVRTR